MTTRYPGKGWPWLGGLLALLLLSLAPVQFHAQDATPEADSGPQALAAAITTDDGLTLHGDYYPLEGETPAVLLLHQLYATRTSWNALIEPLLAHGFAVLAVDLRGWGRSRGAINWRAAQDDTLLWFDWLAEQPGVRGDAIFVMGSSMGANLALVGCAGAETCAGAVAISPGLHYFGVFTEEAVAAGIPALLVYAEDDYRPARDIPQMANLDGFAGEVIVYAGRDHGMALFDAQPELAATILAWLGARAS